MSFWCAPLIFFFFNWGRVDLQCCVSFRCTAKWFQLYIYMYIYISISYFSRYFIIKSFLIFYFYIFIPFHYFDFLLGRFQLHMYRSLLLVFSSLFLILLKFKTVFFSLWLHFCICHLLPRLWWISIHSN